MSYKDLPNQIPIFPLSGVLLLPKGQLPLNIFESRYLAMIDNVLANGRYLGMIQLKGSKTESGSELTEIYNVGCVGRVTAFAEMDDGRYIITLSGLARFKVLKELGIELGFKQIMNIDRNMKKINNSKYEIARQDHAHILRMMK